MNGKHISTAKNPRVSIRHPTIVRVPVIGKAVMPRHAKTIKKTGANPAKNGAATGGHIVIKPQVKIKKVEIIMTAVGIVVASIDPPITAINRISPAVKVKMNEHKKTNAKNKPIKIEITPNATSIKIAIPDTQIKNGKKMNNPIIPTTAIANAVINPNIAESAIRIKVAPIDTGKKAT